MIYKKRLKEGGGIMAFFEKIFNTHLIDRTLSISHDREVITPVPPLSEVTLNFDSITDNRAIEVLNLNKPVKVIYSGGIDSTLALAALIKQLPGYPAADITVILTPESILENQFFYDNFIAGKLTEVLCEDNEFQNTISAQNTSPDCIFVTGELGDQLFGHAHAALNPVSSAKPPEEGMGPPMLKILKPLLDKAPFPLLTSGDVLWWLNFTLKYQWVQLRIFAYVDVEYSQFYHFFDTTEYQQWAMQNDMSVKWPGYEVGKYKWPAKQYIFNVDGNLDYLNNKLKAPSLGPKLIIGNNAYRVILTIDKSFKKKHVNIKSTQTIETNPDDPTRKTVTIEQNPELDIQLALQ